MELDYTNTKITLDWDNASIGLARNYAKKIFREDRVKSVELRQSPTKGFHCIVIFHEPVNVCQERRNYHDDGRRLVNDIMNRPRFIHDVLWKVKVVHGVRWKCILLFKLDKDKT